MVGQGNKKKGLKGFFDKLIYDKSSADALEDDLYNQDTYVSENDFYGADDSDLYGEGSDAAKYGADDSDSYDEGSNDDSIDSYLGDNDGGSSYSAITKGKLGKNKNLIKFKDFTWKMYVCIVVEIILVLYTFYVLMFL